MQSESHLGFVLLEDAGLQHLRRAAHFSGRRAFFGGLEDEQHIAAQAVLRLDQHLRDAHENGGVRVVAAGVHDAHFFAAVARLRHRLEGHVGTLDDGQRIHVGAQRNRGAWLAGPKQRDHAGFCDAGFDFETERLQVLGDDPGGAHFAVGKFRVLVKIPPPRDDLAVNRFGSGFEIVGVSR